MHIVRRLSNSDRATVLRLNASAEPAVARLDSRELSRLTALSQVHLVTADAAGSVVGYALAFFGKDAYDGEEFNAFRRRLSEPFLYIDQVVVSGHTRRSGLGRMLYRHLESSARASGATRLCCEVNINPPNPDSLAFHGRLGFRRLAVLATRDGRTVALLSKAVENEGPGGEV